jgi:hypothetical protein
MNKCLLSLALLVAGCYTASSDDDCKWLEYRTIPADADTCLRVVSDDNLGLVARYEAQVCSTDFDPNCAIVSDGHLLTLYVLDGFGPEGIFDFATAELDPDGSCPLTCAGDL